MATKMDVPGMAVMATTMSLIANRPLHVNGAYRIK